MINWKIFELMYYIIWIDSKNYLSSPRSPPKLPPPPHQPPLPPTPTPTINTHHQLQTTTNYPKKFETQKFYRFFPNSTMMIATTLTPRELLPKIGTTIITSIANLATISLAPLPYHHSQQQHHHLQILPTKSTPKSLLYHHKIRSKITAQLS